MISFNEDEFNEIFLQYNQPLYKYCLKHLGNAYDAEETMCGVYTELFRKWDKLYKSSIKAWLYRTADNLIKRKRTDCHKRQNLSLSEIGDYTTPCPLTDKSITVEQDLSEYYINRITEALTPLRRYIFILKFSENKKTIDIANQLGLPYSTVNDRVIAIRKTAQKIINELTDNK